MLIIDDRNYLRFQNGTIHGGERRYAGTFPRRECDSYGALPFAEPFNLDVPDMASWPDLIADQERDKSSAYDVWLDSKIGVLDQDGLSYCHAFSATDAVMIQREIEGLPYVELSAGSVGGPVTNYRNAGAWIVDDLKQIVSHGVAAIEFVPMMQVSRSGWKPGAEENAKLHRCTEWFDLKSRDFQQHGAALLKRMPVCVGLNYWSHAVTDLKLVDLNPRLSATDEDRYGVLFLNSWGKDFGEIGCAVRSGRKKYADEAYVPRQIAAA